MNSVDVAAVASLALRTGILVAGPLLVAGMVAGILFGVLQAMTQIHEATLTVVPKMAAVIAALAVGGPWMFQTLRTLIVGLYRLIPSVSG